MTGCWSSRDIDHIDHGNITNEFVKASAFSADLGGVEAVAQVIANEVE